jgi:hypothetical protein
MIRSESAGTRLTVNIKATNGIAVNIWEATPKRHTSSRSMSPVFITSRSTYRPEVDQVHQLVRRLGGRILDGPGEFPYAEGPDSLKFECVHMPGLERAYREKGLLQSK